MSTIVFIVIVTFGASLLAAGLVILATIMTSRSTMRLAEQYPEIYSETALADAYRQATQLRLQREQERNRPTTQVTAH